MERVILRREYEPYTKKWGYLACFPDDEANPGYVGAIPFHFIDDNEAIFEPYCEIALGYMYAKKIIHKNEPDIEKCIQMLNKFYNTEFVACERIIRK